MSAGSPIVPIRIPKYLLAVVDQVIQEMNGNRAEEAFTRSSWIIKAIEEKLHKRERSNRRGKRREEEETVVIMLPEEDKGNAGGEGCVTAGQPDNALAPS